MSELIEKMALAYWDAYGAPNATIIDNDLDAIRAALSILTKPENISDASARAAMGVWQQHFRTGNPTSLAQWKEALAAAIKAGIGDSD